ncbi:MAG: sulfotransferase family protein [Chloroflexota bacterium]
MTARRPDFYIVGAPKSGTTAMYAYLREHPDLFLPERKELRYFGGDLDIRDRHRLSEDDYRAYFAEARPEQLVGTAYVWYLYSAIAAREIADFTPDARIIAMIRNPIEMLHALHGEHLSNGNEEISDFTAALDAEPERRAGRRIPPHAHLVQGLWYSTVPRYTEQLQRYANVFGRERLHVIVFDDLAAHTEVVHRGVLRFLGVRDDVRPSAFQVVNASKRTRSERLRHFLARPPDIPRRVIRRVVPASLRRALYERAKRMNVAPAPRSPMPPETRERLRLQFVDEVERLSSFLDRDLTHWTAPAQEAAAGPR